MSICLLNYLAKGDLGTSEAAPFLGITVSETAERSDRSDASGKGRIKPLANSTSSLVKVFRETGLIPEVEKTITCTLICLRYGIFIYCYNAVQNVYSNSFKNSSGILTNKTHFISLHILFSY